MATIDYRYESIMNTSKYYKLFDEKPLRLVDTFFKIIDVRKKIKVAIKVVEYEIKEGSIKNFGYIGHPSEFYKDIENLYIFVVKTKVKSKLFRFLIDILLVPPMKNFLDVVDDYDILITSPNKTDGIDFISKEEIIDNA